MKLESGEFTDGLDSLAIDAWSGLRRRTRPRQVQRLPNGLQAGVWRSCRTLSCSVSLKNEMVDPAQSCISAAVGLVMPSCLWGMNGIGRRGLASGVGGGSVLDS
jgi:hypothetical protein